MPKKASDDDDGAFIQPSLLFQEIKKRNFRLLVTLMIAWVLFLALPFYCGITPADGGFAMLVLGGGCFALLWSSFWLFCRYNLWGHPVLERFSSKFREDYIHYIQLAEEALKEKKGRYTHTTWTKKVLMSNDFVFRFSFYSFDWFHITEVRWVFRYIFRRGYVVFFLYPFFGKSYSLHVYLDDGSKVEIATRRKNIPLLNAFQERAPFACFGYAEDLEAFWNEDRESFINEIRQRLEIIKKTPMPIYEEEDDEDEYDDEYEEEE